MGNQHRDLQELYKKRELELQKEKQELAEKMLATVSLPQWPQSTPTTVAETNHLGQNSRIIPPFRTQQQRPITRNTHRVSFPGPSIEL